MGRKISSFKSNCSLRPISKNPQFYDGETTPKNADSSSEWLTDVFTEDFRQEDYECNNSGSLMKFSLQLISTAN